MFITKKRQIVGEAGFAKADGRAAEGLGKGTEKEEHGAEAIGWGADAPDGSATPRRRGVPRHPGLVEEPLDTRLHSWLKQTKRLLFVGLISTSNKLFLRRKIGEETDGKRDYHIPHEQRNRQIGQKILPQLSGKWKNKPQRGDQERMESQHNQRIPAQIGNERHILPHPAKDHQKRNTGKSSRIVHQENVAYLFRE